MCPSYVNGLARKYKTTVLVPNNSLELHFNLTKAGHSDQNRLAANSLLSAGNQTKYAEQRNTVK